MIVGIAGGSCSGKTTLLKELEKVKDNDFTSLSFDDYFIGTDQLKEEVTDWESPTLYRYDVFIQDLINLKAGSPITIQSRSRESTKSGIRSKEIQPKKLIIIEGFLIFWDKTARELFDKRIFIELPEQEIVRRRLARSEGTSRWDDPIYIKEKLIPGHRKYVEPQREWADLIIDGLKPSEEMAKEVVDFLKG